MIFYLLSPLVMKNKLVIIFLSCLLQKRLLGCRVDLREDFAAVTFLSSLGTVFLWLSGLWSKTTWMKKAAGACFGSYKARFTSAAIKRLIIFLAYFAIEISCHQVNDDILVIWHMVQIALIGWPVQSLNFLFLLYHFIIDTASWPR